MCISNPHPNFLLQGLAKYHKPVICEQHFPSQGLDPPSPCTGHTRIRKIWREFPWGHKQGLVLVLHAEWKHLALCTSTP